MSQQILVPFVDFGDGCTVCVTRENGRLHLSISHKARYPTWDEIRDARYEFVSDDAVMVMVLPPRAEYVSLDPNCFHLWQADTR